jgi:hypothetical protein
MNVDPKTIEFERVTPAQAAAVLKGPIATADIEFAFDRYFEVAADPNSTYDFATDFFEDNKYRLEPEQLTEAFRNKLSDFLSGSGTVEQTVSKEHITTLADCLASAKDIISEGFGTEISNKLDEITSYCIDHAVSEDRVSAFVDTIEAKLDKIVDHINERGMSTEDFKANADIADRLEGLLDAGISSDDVEHLESAINIIDEALTGYSDMLKDALVTIDRDAVDVSKDDTDAVAVSADEMDEVEASNNDEISKTTAEELADKLDTDSNDKRIDYDEYDNDRDRDRDNDDMFDTMSDMTSTLNDSDFEMSDGLLDTISDIRYELSEMLYAILDIENYKDHIDNEPTVPDDIGTDYEDEPYEGDIYLPDDFHMNDDSMMYYTYPDNDTVGSNLATDSDSFDTTYDDTTPDFMNDMNSNDFANDSSLDTIDNDTSSYTDTAPSIDSYDDASNDNYAYDNVSNDTYDASSDTGDTDSIDTSDYGDIEEDYTSDIDSDLELFL